MPSSPRLNLRRGAMIKVLTALTVLTVIATSASAHSYYSGSGGGYASPFGYQSAGPIRDGYIVRSDGFRARGMFYRGFYSNLPAATGGGSLGYNQRLLID
jgi:hypothetical protein